MKLSIYSVERNSNSWHIVEAVVHFHYKEDNQITDYFEIIKEYDIALGSLERTIDTLGIDNIIPHEELRMFLNIFPKRAAT